MLASTWKKKWCNLLIDVLAKTSNRHGVYVNYMATSLVQLVKYFGIVQKVLDSNPAYTRAERDLV